MSLSELSDIELKILLALYRSGGQVVQRGLWKMINVNSRTGMQSLLKLERRKLIVREKISEAMRRAQYIVRLTDEGRNVVESYLKMLGEEVRPTILRIKLIDVSESIPDRFRALMNISCFYCPYLDVCGLDKNISPEACELFSRWLASSVRASTVS